LYQLYLRVILLLIGPTHISNLHFLSCVLCHTWLLLATFHCHGGRKTYT